MAIQALIARLSPHPKAREPSIDAACYSFIALTISSVTFLASPSSIIVPSL